MPTRAGADRLGASRSRLCRLAQLAGELTSYLRCNPTPSARPAVFGVSTFIAAPIPRGPSAPDSAIAAATRSRSSSSESCAGR